MVVVGKHFLHFAYCGLVVEIQIHLTAKFSIFCCPNPTSRVGLGGFRASAQDGDGTITLEELRKAILLPFFPGVGRGGPEVRFHEGSTRVPPGFHKGSTRVPPGFHQGSTRFCKGCGVVRALKRAPHAVGDVT